MSNQLENKARGAEACYSGLLLYWSYEQGMDVIEDFAKRVYCNQLCVFLEEERDLEYYEGLSIDVDELYVYRPIDYYRHQIIEHELDETVFNSLKAFELDALEIINRWIKSLSVDLSFYSVYDIYLVMLRYWYDYLIKKNIQLLIYNIMPHIPCTFIPFMLCKALSIPTIIAEPITPATGEKINYFLRTDIHYVDDEIKNRYELSLSHAVELDSLDKNLETIIERFCSTDYSNKRVVFMPTIQNKYELFNKYWNRVNLYIKNKQFRLLIKKIEGRAVFRINTKSYLKRISMLEEDADFSKKYFLFPLHLQPEETTLPRGGVYRNQILAIRLLSKAMPDGYTLYVKEHPAYWKLGIDQYQDVKLARPMTFYNEIKKMKNVKLIKHDIDSIKLLKHCIGVVTITGTIGLEAIFNHKPTLLFGNSYYEAFESVYKVKSYRDCESALKKICNSEYYLDYDISHIRRYFRVLQDYIVPMGTSPSWSDYSSIGVPAVNSEEVLTFFQKVELLYHEILKSK